MYVCIFELNDFYLLILYKVIANSGISKFILVVNRLIGLMNLQGSCPNVEIIVNIMGALLE